MANNLALEPGLSQEMPMGLTISTLRLLDRIIFVSIFESSRFNITRLWQSLIMVVI